MRCRTSNRHVAIRVTSYIESIISAIFATRKLVAILVWFTTACTGMRQKMTESSSFEFACDSIAIVGKSPACCSSFAFNDSAVLREQQDNRTKSYRNCKWRTVTAAVSQRVVDDRLISFSVHGYGERVFEWKIIPKYENARAHYTPCGRGTFPQCEHIQSKPY